MTTLDLAIRSIVVAGAGLVIVSAIRRFSSATRHVVLALSLLALCVLPFVSSVLPAWHVPFVRVQAPAQTYSAPLAILAPVAPVHAARISPDSVLLLAWAAVAGALALRMMFRLVRLKGLEARLEMLSDPVLQPIVAEFCRRRKRKVVLLDGESNEPSMTWGHSRPVLVLPHDARQWPEERLKSVVLHELAHVERSDWLVALCAQFICAAFWFNPFVWMIARRMELEAETAADDRVLSLGVSGPEYASHLVELVREMHGYHRAVGGAMAMAHPARLDSRVRSILEFRRNRRTAGGSVLLGILSLLAGIVALVGAATPTIERAISSEHTQRSTSVASGPEVNVTVDRVEAAAARSEVRDGPTPYVRQAISDRWPMATPVTEPLLTHASHPSPAPKAAATKPSTTDLKVEISSQLATAKSQIQSALKQVRSATARIGAQTQGDDVEIDIDPTDIADAAIETADAGLAQAEKESDNALTTGLLSQIRKGLKQVPPHGKAHP